MKKKLYLYTDPFVHECSPGQVSDYLFDYLSENDRLDQDRINNLLLEFAANHQIITNDEGTLRASSQDNTGSWIWQVIWMNFRSLVGRKKYNLLMSSMAEADSYPINLVIDLHARLGVLFNHQLLNTIVHRTLTSIALIPYTSDEDDEVLDWETIHKETPFVWILIMLQAIIRSTVSPAKIT